MMAFQALRRAYNIDVAPILAKARARRAGRSTCSKPIAQPVRARKAQERKPVGLGAGIV
jgi:L-rhamnose isomerase/sugar isomerase